VTGADGNFYFDLVPDEYIISVEDSLGRATKDESLLGGVPADRLAHYQHEWHITEDWFYVPQVDNSVDNDFRVMTDAAGTPVAFSTLVQPPLSSGVKNVNFLLEGSALADISGVVFADVTPAGTGDGVFNGNDVAAPGFIVYLDTNNSGQFELTDEYVTTGADGRYSLSVDLEDTSVVRLAAIPLNANWIATNPAGAVYSLLVSPGDILSEQNFAFRPTNGSGNAAGNTPGSILGVAFDDVNGDGVRQANELGISGLRVFHDLDSSGTWDANEPFAFTTDNGAYFLANITPGSVRLDIEISSALSLTTPVAGFRTVMLLSDGTVTNQLFGIRNQSNSDWGDLAGYPTLLVDNGPRHVVVPGFQLGAKIDMEMDGQPTANADGDDAVMGDEDGVVIVSNGGLLQPGANTVRVTVRGVGGYLNAWMDFNNDGDFTDPGEQIFADLHLNQGPNGTSLSHDLIVTAPAGMAGGPIAARFRWGNPGLSFVGPDTIGEVEDYRLANSLQPVLVFASGDFDQSGLVDHDDYVLWKATYGTSDLRADGNNDGQVNSADYTIWRNNMGAESYFGAGAATGAGSASTLAAGASVALANPSAARAAAFARALAVQNDISGGQHSEGDAVVAARLMAAGAVPMTVQVGNITQTVYYLPSQDGSAALPTGWTIAAHAVLPTSEVTTATEDAAAPSTSSDSLATSSALRTRWFDGVDAVHQRASNSHQHEASNFLAPERISARSDHALRLLERAWSNYARGRDEFDVMPLSQSTGDDENEAMDLAVAALFAEDSVLPASL
jgi:hypothetical protein